MGIEEGLDGLGELEWAALVHQVLARHPEWAAVTVQCMQSGLLAALERAQGRTEEVSMGLWEAMRTRPAHVRRHHERIIRGIEASTLKGTPWAVETVETERRLRAQKEERKGRKVGEG